MNSLDITENPIEMEDYLPACLVKDREGMLSEDQLTQINALYEFSNKQNCFDSRNHLENLTQIELKDKGIKTLIYFKVLKNIQSISLHQNEIEDVTPLASLPRLSKLWLPHNKVSSLQSFVELKNLTHLYLNNNPLDSLADISSLQKLTHLDISETRINNIRVLNCHPALIEVLLGDLDLKLDSFMDYCLVHLLSPEGSNFLGEDLEFMKAIMHIISQGEEVDPLECKCKRLKDKVASMTTLNLNKKNLSSIDPLRYFVSLKKLYLIDNNISDLRPLSSITKLEKLDISNNKISNMEYLPTEKLRDVNLSSNEISTLIPSYYFYLLKKLNLSNNRISKITRTDLFPQLEELILAKNNLEYKYNENYTYKPASIELLERNHNLYLLDLTDNKIDSCYQLKNYTLQFIGDVRLKGNPCRDDPLMPPGGVSFR